MSDLDLSDFRKQAEDLGLLEPKRRAKPHLAAAPTPPGPARKLLRLRAQYEPESLCLIVERTRCGHCGSEWAVPRNTLLWGIDKATGAARGLAVSPGAGWANLPRTIRYLDHTVYACPSCFLGDAGPHLNGADVSLTELAEQVRLSGDDYHYIYHWQEPFSPPPASEEWRPPAPTPDAVSPTPSTEDPLDDLKLDF